MIGQALESSFVFRGIDKRRLQEVGLAENPTFFSSTSISHKELYLSS